MQAIELWHEIVRSQDPTRLPEILTEDCVMLSPVVHTPQRGRDITVLYLSAAMHVFGDGFHYLKEIVSDDHAALEFECEVEGILINGIDILTFADDGRISEFKVMVRPLQAVNKLHEKMGQMLEQLKRG